MTDFASKYAFAMQGSNSDSENENTSQPEDKNYTAASVFTKDTSP